MVTTALDQVKLLYAVHYAVHSHRTHTKQLPVQLRQTELVITLFVAVTKVSVVAETGGVGVVHVPTNGILPVV